MLELSVAEAGGREEGVIQKLVLFLVAVCGLLLIAGAILLADRGHPLLGEISKELGIAVLAVFSVSYLYEITLARHYMTRFIRQLRAEMTHGHDNAANCALLGIEEIFHTRRIYEQRYAISRLLSAVDGSCEIQLVARSAFTLLARASDQFLAAVRAGAKVEICILDPQPPSDVALNIDVDVEDLYNSLLHLERQVVTPLRSSVAPGELLIKLHRVQMLDSFLYIRRGAEYVCTWDLSFGRDVDQKMVLVLDTRKPLGTELRARYGHVLQKARPIFHYRDKVVLDAFPRISSQMQEIVQPANVT